MLNITSFGTIEFNKPDEEESRKLQERALTETNQIVLSGYSTQSFSERVLSPSAHLPTFPQTEPDSLSSILTQMIFLESPPTILSISPSLPPSYFLIHSSKQSPYPISPINSMKMRWSFSKKFFSPPFTI